MKIFKKLNQSGFSHLVLPALIVAAVAGIGIYALAFSHADTLTPACYNTYNSSTTESVSICPIVFNTTNAKSGFGIMAELDAYNVPSNAKPNQIVLNLERCSKKGARCKIVKTTSASSYSVSNVSSWPNWESLTSWANFGKSYSYKACAEYTDGSSMGWKVDACSPLAIN